MQRYLQSTKSGCTVGFNRDEGGYDFLRTRLAVWAVGRRSGGLATSDIQRRAASCCHADDATGRSTDENNTQEANHLTG